MEWAYPPAPPDTLRKNLKGECNTIYLLLFLLLWSTSLSLETCHSLLSPFILKYLVYINGSRNSPNIIIPYFPKPPLNMDDICDRARGNWWILFSLRSFNFLYYIFMSCARKLYKLCTDAANGNVGNWKVSYELMLKTFFELHGAMIKNMTISLQCSFILQSFANAWD